MLNSSQSSATTPTSFGSFDTTTPASSVALERLMSATKWDAGAKENGDAPESSKMGGDATAHAQALASHLYHSGFLSAEYSDIDLHVLNSVYQLHRIVLARSPHLAHYMGMAGPGLPIRIPIIDGTITDESVRIVLQNLYAPSQSLVTPTNARAVLATAFTFGGMPELCAHAYNTARQAIGADTIIDYVQWIDREGATPPGFPVHDANEQGSGGWREDAMVKYGEWSLRLKQDIITFIIRTLPVQLAAAAPGGITTNTTLISIYASLPYVLLKRCIESPAFKFGADQERFQFAKKVVAARKKTVGATVEESVVLAFKGDSGSAVHITRKPKRKAALWKVEQ